MKNRIFYSWQSDLPNNTNRAFINNALEKAIEEITSDDTFSLIPFLDRDTVGLTGSPDIAASIFDKIDNSSIFVCDISIVNGVTTDYRVTPNPNVLIELGYAISRLGWIKIILVMNEHYGGVESLPFDLRGRKVLTYNIASDAVDKATEKKKVSSILRNGIREILININNTRSLLPSTKVVAVEKDQDLVLEQEAARKLKVIKSISYTQQKNEALIKATEQYIAINRYDLAVGFALDITYTQHKNKYLIQIATLCIANNDLVTAQRATAGITYTQQRNQLSMQLLELLEK